MGCHILNYQSRILDEQTLRGIESAVKGIEEREGGVLSTTTSASTRAVGNAIQSVVPHRFESVIGDLVTLENGPSPLARVCVSHDFYQLLHGRGGCF